MGDKTLETLTAMVYELATEVRTFIQEQRAPSSESYAQRTTDLQQVADFAPGDSAAANDHACSYDCRDFGEDRRRTRRGTVYCYRCGEPGHVQIGCRVNISHMRHPHQGFCGEPWERGITKATKMSPNFVSKPQAKTLAQT
jgi:hypothetical protein